MIPGVASMTRIKRLLPATTVTVLLMLATTAFAQYKPWPTPFPPADALHTHGRLQWSVASGQFGYKPTVRRGHLLIGCLLILCVIFLLNDPILAMADGIVWAKKAVAIREDCYDKSPQKIFSPNGKVTVQVLCHAADSDGDRVRYFRITDSAGRTNDVEFEGQYQRGVELHWSPDSTAFFVNGNETSISGNYVYVYRFGGRGVAKLDVTQAAQRDMVLSFPPCKAIFDQQPDCRAIEKNPEYNMSAIDWAPNKSAIVVMAEVPCSSDYGGIMCQVLGYELEVPTGKILSRMTATELKKKWQSSMNWKMNIPSPPEYGRPK
jgi:hypothetical protein